MKPVLPQQLERLLAQAKQVHLTTTELDLYLQNKLPSATLARVEAHLRDCLVCEQHLADLQETLQLVQAPLETIVTLPAGAVSGSSIEQPEWQKWLITQVQELAEHLSSALEQWLPNRRQVWAQAAGERRGETPSGMRWEIVEEDGMLVILFSSANEKAAGSKLLLRWGQWRQIVVLEELIPNEISAELRIWPEQRKLLGEGKLEITPVTEA